MLGKALLTSSIYRVYGNRIFICIWNWLGLIKIKILFPESAVLKNLWKKDFYLRFSDLILENPFSANNLFRGARSAPPENWGFEHGNQWILGFLDYSFWVFSKFENQFLKSNFIWNRRSWFLKILPETISEKGFWFEIFKSSDNWKILFPYTMYIIYIKAG